jgi:SAM-dependent methyltransferase
MTQAARSQALQWTGDGESRLSPAANWLWFAPAIGRASALVIGEIAPSYLRGLSTHFERIEKIPVASLYPAVESSDGKAPGRVRLVLGEGSMDYVISTDLVHGWSNSGSPYRDPHFVAALTELRRVLRPGGVLFLSGQNARCHKAWLRTRSGDSAHRGSGGGAGASLRLRAAKRVLARAGFSETRAYFVEPSVGDVATVVPACRRAAVAYERDRFPRTNVPWRALCAAGGLYELLYPDAFVLAIA